MGLYLGKKYKIPVALTYHTKFEEYVHNISFYKSLYKIKESNKSKAIKRISDNIINITKEKLIPLYISYFCNKCDLIIAPTNSIKQQLTNYQIQTKINIVPTGINQNLFDHEKEQVKKIKDIYKKDKKYLFCTVSRLSKEKNIEFMIDAIKSLKSKVGDNFVLLIIGEGPLREKLQSKIKEYNLENNIKLIGNIENDKINNYYKASDLFLFTSKSETQGIVILEAMASSTPVVAISSSGIDDILVDGINGYKTKDDINDWTDKIIKLLNDKCLMDKCIYGAHQTANKYRQQNISKYMISSYLEINNKHSKEIEYDKKAYNYTYSTNM